MRPNPKANPNPKRPSAQASTLNNQYGLFGTNERRKADFKALGKSSRWVTSHRVTNYGVFSVEEGFDSVTVSALLQSYKCSFRDGNIGGFCQVIATNMCHRKPLMWDTNDRAYTVHRILCATLILSAMIGYCCPGAPPMTRFLPNSVLDDVFVSPFCDRPSRLVRNIAYETICVYPTLVEMDRILPTLRSGSVFNLMGNRTWNYVLAVCVVVFGIGGGANLLASSFTQRPVRGFASVVAAALGYRQRISNVRNVAVLATAYGQDVTAGRAYWGSLAWIVFGSGDDWVPPLVAWLVAGLAGSMLAASHLENIALLGGVLKLFGLA